MPIQVQGFKEVPLGDGFATAGTLLRSLARIGLGRFPLGHVHGHHRAVRPSLDLEQTRKGFIGKARLNSVLLIFDLHINFPSGANIYMKATFLIRILILHGGENKTGATPVPEWPSLRRLTFLLN